MKRVTWSRKVSEQRCQTKCSIQRSLQHRLDMWPALVSQLGRQMASRELCSASLVASSSRVLLPPRQITLRALSTSAVRQKKKGSTSGSKNVKKHQEHADIAGDKEDASSGSKVDLPPILEKLEVKMKAATDAAQRFAYDQVERGQGRIHPCMCTRASLDSRPDDLQLRLTLSRLNWGRNTVDECCSNPWRP